MGERQNIIVIVLDTQRVDRLSCYNPTAPQTRNIDKLAQNSTFFTHAVSPAQWTLPTHASLFTGLYPTQHTTQQLNSILPPDISTLAELLRDGGYSTHLFSNNPIVGNIKNGLTRGFEFIHNFIHIGVNVWSATTADKSSSKTLIHFVKQMRSTLVSLLGVGEEPTVKWSKKYVRLFLELAIRVFYGSKYHNTRRTLRAASQLFKKTNENGKPVFAFINLMGTHVPYDPPRWAFRRIINSELSTINTPSSRWEVNNIQTNPINWHKAEKLTYDMKQSLLAYYDAEVIAQDHLIGGFLNSLHRWNQLDNTFLVIVSDHGDHLGERERVNHILGAYEPLIHVPLIIWDSKQQIFNQGQVVDSFFSTLNLFSILLTIAGIGKENVTHLSTINIPFNLNNTYLDPAYTESLAPQAFLERIYKQCPECGADNMLGTPVYAVYYQNRKLIYQKYKSSEMYAICSDLDEKMNLVEIEKELTLELLGLLINFINRMQPVSDSCKNDNIDKKIVTRLRDLGYVE